MIRIAAALSILAFLVLLSAPASARITLTGVGINSNSDFDGTEGFVAFDKGEPGNLDVVICSTYSAGTNSFLPPVPGDWPAAAESSCGSGSCILGVFAKPGESDPGDITCRWTQNTEVFAAGILRYTGADADAPVIASACESGASGIAAAPSVITEPGSEVLRLYLYGGNELLLGQQELEGLFLIPVTSQTGQFVLLAGLQSFFPEGGDTGSQPIFLGDRSPWTACTIALRGAINPIPTMSEWGLIAFAGMAGIASLLIIRRRARTA